MDRSLLFFTMSLVCFYLIVDEFIGKKRVSSILDLLGQDQTDQPIPRMPFDPNYDPKTDGERIDPTNPFENKDLEQGTLTSTITLNPLENPFDV